MRWIYVVIIVLIETFAFLSLARTQEILGNLDLVYTTSKTTVDGDTTKTWRFSQNYYLSYVTKLTPAIGLDSTLHYTHSESDRDESRLIYPSIGLNLINEYVVGNLSFDLMDTDSSRSPRLTNYFVNLNFSSRLEKWPKVNFQYTHNRQYDHLQDHQTDNVSDMVISGFIYDYGLGELMYNFTGMFSQDYVEEVDQDSYNHITRLTFHKSFFNNRLSFYTDCGYNYYEIKTKVPGIKTIEQRRRAIQGFYGVDDTPKQSDPGTFTITDQLIDTNKEVPVFQIKDNMNIGLGLDIAQSVDTLYIYTDRNYIYDNESITWAVYYTNEDTEPRTWTKISDAAQFSYDNIQHRFEIKFTSTTARYFKVVYKAPTISPPSFEVTEIEAYGETLIEGETESKTKTYTSNAGISIRPLDKWTASYHVTYYKTDSFLNSYPASMSYNFNQGVSLTGELTSKLLLTLSYQTTENRSAQKNASQLYSLNLRYTPFETLTSTLTVSHGTTEVDGEKSSESNTIVLSNVAEVWEGINVNWDVNINFTKNPRTDVSTKSVFSSIYIRAILTKHLTWDIDYDQNWQKTDNSEQETTTSTSISTTVVYTPSSRIYGRLYIQYNNREEGNALLHQYTLGCFLTRKIQMNATSQFNHSSDGSDQMTHSLDFIFNLGRKSSFRTGYSFSQNKKETTQTSHNFYMRFSSSF